MKKYLMERLITKNINDGIGVNRWMLMKEIARGKWPCFAPTKNNLDEANMLPFSEPNVEHTTNKGIIHRK